MIFYPTQSVRQGLEQARKASQCAARTDVCACTTAIDVYANPYGFWEGGFALDADVAEKGARPGRNLRRGAASVSVL